MHRHRTMYHGIHAPYPYHHHHHYGMNFCSPYEYIEPLPTFPDVHACAPPPPPPPLPCYYDYPHRRTVPYVDYPYYDYVPRVHPRPPVVQTNVRNDVAYYLDEPPHVYDDEYGQTYRLSRSKVQLVDIEPPRNRPARNSNRMVVSTFQSRDRREPERILVPRNPSMPLNDRQRRMKLVPLYHSADPQYPVRRRSVAREIVPVATVADSHQNRQTIRVRSLSPL